MKSTSSGVLAIIGALLIGAVGFFAGTRVGPRFGWTFGNRPMMYGNRPGNMMYGRGYNAGGHGMMGAGGTAQITKVTGNTVTLEFANGTTNDVTVSGQTVVYTMTKGTTTDLKVGQNVILSNGNGFFGGTQTIVVRPQ